MKNILIVHNYYQIAGGEDTVVANERKLLTDHGNRVIFYSRNNSELKEYGKLKKLLLPFNTIFNIGTYKEIKKLIKKEHIDIVHVHNTLNIISPSVYYAARSCHVPIVQTMHNFRLLCPGATFYRDGHICEDCIENGLKCSVKHACYRDSKLQTLACAISTQFHRQTGIYSKINYICLTEFNKKKLLQLKGVSEDHIFIKPNFTYSNDVPHNAKDYFLFIGRTEKIKGMEILLDAFSKLPDEKLHIAGTGYDFDKYKNETISRKLDNITFLGFMKKHELEKELASAKAVIVASQWYETFGMIIAEAYAAHVPVITGDIGNIGILVKEGQTGTHFKYDSADSLAEAVKRFNDSDTSTWGDNAYKEYKDNFSPEVNYRILEKIYDSVHS